MKQQKHIFQIEVKFDKPCTKSAAFRLTKGFVGDDCYTCSPNPDEPESIMITKVKRFNQSEQR